MEVKAFVVQINVAINNRLDILEYLRAQTVDKTNKLCPTDPNLLSIVPFICHYLYSYYY